MGALSSQSGHKPGTRAGSVPDASPGCPLIVARPPRAEERAPERPAHPPPGLAYPGSVCAQLLSYFWLCWFSLGCRACPLIGGGVPCCRVRAPSWHAGSAALRHTAGSPQAGIKPPPPASAGGPSPTEPPGEPLSFLKAAPGAVCAQVALKVPVRRGVGLATHALARCLLPTPARSLLCRLFSGIRGAPGAGGPGRARSALPPEPLDPDTLLDGHAQRQRWGRWRWQHRAGSRQGDKIVGELSTSQASKPAASLSEMTGYC